MTDVNIQGDYGHGEIVYSCFSRGHDCDHGMWHRRNSADGSVIATQNRAGGFDSQPSPHEGFRQTSASPQSKPSPSEAPH